MSAPQWDDDAPWDDDDDHDRFHPWMFAGCSACNDRADWLERLYQERTAGTR